MHIVYTVAIHKLGHPDLSGNLEPQLTVGEFGMCKQVHLFSARSGISHLGVCAVLRTHLLHCYAALTNDLLSMKPTMDVTTG